MDYSNTIIGDVKIIRRVEGDLEKCREHLKLTGKTKAPKYECECLLCGKKFISEAYRIKNRRYKNCGCQQFDNLVGKKFDKLTVTKFLGTNKHTEHIWECVCDCGTICTVTTNSLMNRKFHRCRKCAGKAISATKTKMFYAINPTRENIRLHETYVNMITRCYNKNYKAFERYGGRGIKVCEEWKQDENKFAEWATCHGYDIALTLDRIDNDGNYEPNNCRFVDRTVQANNRKTNYILEYNGEKDTLANWARRLNLGYYYIQSRAYKGKSLEEIVKETRNDNC